MSPKINTIVFTEDELDVIWTCISTEVLATMAKNVESKAVDWDHICNLKKLRDKIDYAINHFHDDEF